MKTRYTCLTTLLLALCSAPAAAQDDFGAIEIRPQSNTRGFLIGAHGGSASIQLDGAGTGNAETGFGGGLTLGYGINDHIAVLLRGDLANVEYADDETQTFSLVHVDLGGRYSFSNDMAALRPFLELSLQGVSIVDEIGENEVVLSGGALGFQGGIEYFVTRNVAIEAGLAVSKGVFTTAEVNGDRVEDPDEDFTSTRLNLGITLHP